MSTHYSLAEVWHNSGYESLPLSDPHMPTFSYMFVFCGLALSSKKKGSLGAGMAENHVAGKAAMGQLRKVLLTEVSGGWFEQQTAGSWQAHLVSYKDPKSPSLLSGANLS